MQEVMDLPATFLLNRSLVNQQNINTITTVKPLLDFLGNMIYCRILN
jgi:hypothetical protein